MKRTGRQRRNPKRRVVLIRVPFEEYSYKRSFYQVSVSETTENLEIHNRELTSIPQQIGYLDNLRKLDLSNNLLTSISPAIGQLCLLEHLDLAHNCIHNQNLPREMRNLSKLTWLSLKHNWLYDVPVALLDLPLEYLNLKKNHLDDPFSVKLTDQSVIATVLSPLRRVQNKRSVCAYLHAALECDASLIEVIFACEMI